VEVSLPPIAEHEDAAEEGARCSPEIARPLPACLFCPPCRLRPLAPMLDTGEVAPTARLIGEEHIEVLAASLDSSKKIPWAACIPSCLRRVKRPAASREKREGEGLSEREPRAALRYCLQSHSALFRRGCAMASWPSPPLHACPADLASDDPPSPSLSNCCLQTRPSSTRVYPPSLLPLPG